MMRRRTLIDLLSGRNDMVKYGYFEIENERDPGTESYQVSTTDFNVEIDTGLTIAPHKIICTYIDPMKTSNRGASVFFGDSISNGYSEETTTANTIFDLNSFKSSEALYLIYEESTGKIYLHTRQWAWIKCGKWIWIAIYN